VITFSRSAVVTRKSCEMKRFLNYDYPHPFASPVTGIVPLTELSAKSTLPRERGKILHEAAEALFKGQDWKQIIRDRCREWIGERYRDEQEVLIRRAILGWSVKRAELLEHYSVMSAEAEWSWQMYDNIRQVLRMDRILRRTEDGLLAILDFKTMKAPDSNWIARMQHSDQTHLYIQALKERTNEYVLGMIYEGIIIGSMNQEGRQQSPFVMGWKKPNGFLSPKYVAGWPKVWTLDWSDKRWLEWAQTPVLVKGENVTILDELYCSTGIVSPSNKQLLETKSSTAHAELRWYNKVQEIRQIAETYGTDSLEFEGSVAMNVERNPDTCLKFGYDYQCPYHRVCWDGAYVDEETFTSREDHHAPQSETEVD